jgi:hypothetical protein
MEAVIMGKTTSGEYQAALAEAGEHWEKQSAVEQSEAKQFAHALARQAPKPRRRVDGLPVASEHKRGQPLTVGQQRFIQGVIRGQSLRSSYREAFQNDTGSDASISASANKLMKDPRVQEALKEAWGETIEHLIDDVVASKRYVLKGLLALSKDSQPSTQLKALELMGKACGLFTPTEVQDKAPVTADQLKRELASHLKLLKGDRSSVMDVQATAFKQKVRPPVDDGV